MIHLVRIFFLLVVLGITVSYAFIPEVYSTGQNYITLYILLPVLAAMALVFVDTFWHNKRLQMLSGLFFGVLAGLTIAYMLSLIVNLVVSLFPAADIKTVQMIKLLLGAITVFMCVSFVLQTKDDFRFVIPYVEFSRQTKGSHPLLLDTSVIIDGRIADIADTQILESEIIVPRFVLAELQAVADSDDKLKRNRGRRGLDILGRLQKSDKLEIRLMDAHVSSVDDAADVDAKLVALAKHLDGKVVTNDYNLNKICQLRGVAVININDLANALKPVALPGEAMAVKIIKPGEESGQGIGYLEDGTMVVVEQARDSIGKDVTITVTSALQTSAGRMIFGRLDADKPPRRDRNSPQTPPDSHKA